MNSLSGLLVELDKLHGVSGDEEQVAHFVKEELMSYVDEFYEDALGNQIYTKKGKNPNNKIMLAAHMDEIGYIVSHIDEQGFISFLPVGIHDPRMSVNQVMRIKTSKGEVIGVIGNKPSHIVPPEEAQKAIPFESLFLDVGTNSKQETLDLGVNVGDTITIQREGQFLNQGKVFTGKSVDNRSGCAVLIQVMKELQETELDVSVVAAFTVQEEVGIRGAGPAAFQIEPDVALSIDVAFAGGTPGINEKMIPIKLGEGPAIKFFDWSLRTFNGNAVSKKLTSRLINIADEKEIPIQREAMIHGATDASKISLSGKGVLTGGISIPLRYMHSSVECVHMNDLENTVSLIKEFIKSEGRRN